MAGELPPAVAKFIADVTQYTEPLQRAIEATQKFAGKTDEASLKARQMGLAARESADKAAAAMEFAKEAADKYARGEIDLAAATEAATKAAQAQLRADLDLAAAQKAIAAATDKASKEKAKAAAQDQKTGFMEMGLAQKAWVIANYATGSLEPIAAAGTVVIGSLAASIASAGIGLGAFGLVAKSVLSSAVQGATAAKTAQTAYTSAVARANLTYQQSIANAKTHAQVLSAETAHTKALQSAQLAQSQAMKQAYNGMSSSQIELGKQIMHAKDEWQAFVAANSSGVAKIISQGLGLLPNIFRMLQPFMAPVERALSGIINDLARAIQPAQQFSTVMTTAFHGTRTNLAGGGTAAGGLAQFMGDMASHAEQSITNLLHAMMNLAAFVGKLIEDFAPLSGSVSGGFVKMTAALEHWAAVLPQTQGFQTMIGMFKTQGPTIVTIFKNLAEIAKQFAADMGNSASNMLWLKFLPQLTGFVAQFMKANPVLVQWVMNLMLIQSTSTMVFGKLKQVGTSIWGIGTAATGAASNVSKFIKGFNSAEQAASEATGAAGTFGGKIRAALNAAPFGNFIKGFKSAEQAENDATGAAGTFGGKMRSIFTGIATAASTSWSGIKTAGQAAWGWLSGLPAMLSGAVAAVKEWAIWSKIAAAATKVWTVIQAAFDVVMDANPLILIALAIIALIAVVVLCYTHFKTFRDIINDIGRFIAGFFVAAFKQMKAVIADVLNWIRSNWPLLLAIITGPIGLAVYFIVKYWNDIYSFFSGIINDIINFVKNHWQLILAIITGPIGLAVYFITKYWNDIYAFFSKIIGDIVNFVRSHWPLLLAIITGPLGLAVYFVVKYWNDIKNFFAQGVDWVINRCKSLLSSILNVFKGVGSLLFNAGKWLVQGFINGIESMFGSIVNAAWNMIQSLGGSVLKVLGIGSPSKVAMYWGSMTGEGLVQGMLGHQNAVKQAAAKMAQGVNTGIASGIHAAVPLGITTGTSVSSALTVGGGGGNIIVQCDGKTLFNIMKSQLYKYNIRNSGTVTGIVKPAL